VSQAVTVRIYIKPFCALCEEAKGVLEEIRTRVVFVLEVVDVRDSPDTWERYRHAVPVVTLDGEEIGRLRIDSVALESRLRGTSAC